MHLYKVDDGLYNASSHNKKTTFALVDRPPNYDKVCMYRGWSRLSALPSHLLYVAQLLRMACSTVAVVASQTS